MEIINKNLQEFEIDLECKGYEEIGHGFFASVYAHRYKKTVLKIFENDRAYLAFCEAIINLKNPYFPEIKSVLQYKYVNKNNADDFFSGQSWYVVELEKLRAFHSENKQVQILSKYKRELRRETKHDIFDLELYVISKKLKTIKDKNLVQAIRILRRLKAKGYEFDIHNDNYMFRKQKNKYQLVFTDPIYRG